MFTPTAETIAASQMTAFMRHCTEKTGETFADAAAFHAFSVRDSSRFWSLFLDWSSLLVEGPRDRVCTSAICEEATAFPDLRLSYVENLLRVGDMHEEERVAITACGPLGRRTRITRKELRERVLRVAAQFERLGVVLGDRIAIVAHNDENAIIAALAAAALGAAVSSASPEMGARAIIDRIAPLGPVLLLAHLEGPRGSDELSRRIGELVAALPALHAVIALDDGPFPSTSSIPQLRLSLLSRAETSPLLPLPWRRFPFNQPLFILFSSGTTGTPKCIVHGAGGTLVEHLKEHRLHGDLRARDTLFFHTSCAWMMWNWQLSALATGASLVLYAGPIESAETLWRIVSEERVTVFGTSPTYLQLCEESGYAPKRALPLPELRALLSTGSILYDTQYDWVRDQVGPIPLQSISGGTDILGCFVLGHPNRPVYRGECQSLSLGLDVQAFLGAGERTDAIGELICRNPFPSRPLGFFGDADGHRFHEAYFQQHEGVWTHGDLIEIAPDGGAHMHGRSDGILNVHGVRIGPAEIYRILQSVPEIAECLAVEETVEGRPTQSRLVLLVVLRAQSLLDGALKRRIRAQLARDGSAFHVPDLIVAVHALPTTHSGKRSERSARDAVNGRIAANREALHNPESLDEIRAVVEESRRASSSSGAASAGPLLARLTSIWERLLDVAPLASDENFFALGGTSLLAMRFCALAHEETGTNLTPSMLLEAPTLERLVKLIESQASAPQTLLVPLRREGTGRPLFVLPGLAGEVLELAPLAQLLQCDRPVIALRARGLDPREAPHATVEAMAADCIAEIRTHSPAGPYALAGYSFGGLVAFEMAAMLRAAGEVVEFVGLFDTDVHDVCLAPRERMIYRTLRTLHRITSRLPAPSKGLLARARAALRSRIEQRLGATCSEIPMPRWRTESLPPAMARVDAAAWAAFHSYRPRLHSGPTTFFHALQRAPDYCNPLPILRAATEDQLNIVDVPGDHFTMIQEPHVRQLAARVSTFLAGR
jgi:acetoacetyl-CoA synthetase